MTRWIGPAVFVPSSSWWEQLIDAIRLAWRNGRIRRRERAEHTATLDLEQIERRWRR